MVVECCRYLCRLWWIAGCSVRNMCFVSKLAACAKTWRLEIIIPRSFRSRWYWQCYEQNCFFSWINFTSLDTCPLHKWPNSEILGISILVGIKDGHNWMVSGREERPPRNRPDPGVGFLAGLATRNLWKWGHQKAGRSWVNFKNAPDTDGMSRDGMGGIMVDWYFAAIFFFRNPEYCCLIVCLLACLFLFVCLFVSLFLRAMTISTSHSEAIS